MNTKLKAYITYPGNSPYDSGCLLVYAPNRNKARVEALKLFDDYSFRAYCYMTALRRQDYDKFAVGDGTYSIETNAGLPDGAPMFYDDDIS